jgi:hypothetical protein
MAEARNPWRNRIASTRVARTSAFPCDARRLPEVARKIFSLNFVFVGEGLAPPAPRICLFSCGTATPGCALSPSLAPATHRHFGRSKPTFFFAFALACSSPSRVSSEMNPGCALIRPAHDNIVKVHYFIAIVEQPLVALTCALTLRLHLYLGPGCKLHAMWSNDAYDQRAPLRRGN